VGQGVGGATQRANPFGGLHLPDYDGLGGWMGNHPETIGLRRGLTARLWERLADAPASLRTAEAKQK